MGRRDVSSPSPLMDGPPDSIRSKSSSPLMVDSHIPSSPRWICQAHPSPSGAVLTIASSSAVMSSPRTRRRGLLLLSLSAALSLSLLADMAIAKIQSVTGNGATVALNGVVANNPLTFKESCFDGASGAPIATPTDSNGTFTVASADAGANSPGLGFAITGIWVEAGAASGTHTVTPSARGRYNGTHPE